MIEIVIYTAATIGVLTVLAATALAISMVAWHVRDWLGNRKLQKQINRRLRREAGYRD